MFEVIKMLLAILMRAITYASTYLIAKELKRLMNLLEDLADTIGLPAGA